MPIDPYFSDLNRKISKYSAKYRSSERKAALRLLLWNLKAICFPHRKRRFPASMTEDLKIGFLLKGGMGDLLLSFNYLAYFRNFLGETPYRLTLFTDPKRVETARSLTDQEIVPDQGYCDPLDFDLFLEMFQVPRVVCVNLPKISRLSPQLLTLIKEYQFEEKFGGESFSVPIYRALLFGRSRIQQADIGAHLGMTEEYQATIPFPSNPEEVLTRLGLPEKFITISRSADATHSRALTARYTKIVPEETFEKLLPLLKERYPALPIVQLGISLQRSPTVKGVDFSLVGKTSLDELKVVLKRSLCHIDGEGGYVHLRHALKASPSVVLFGPTPKKFYGYFENINLHSGVCSWCEGAPTWSENCSIGEFPPPCMAQISVETIFQAVQKVVESGNPED